MPQVTVACRLPHGMRLRIYELVKTTEVIMGGTRDVLVSRQKGDDVVVNGWSEPQNHAKKHLVEGFAITPGVDKEFFDKWLSQNKDSDVVKNGLIFAHEKEGNTFAEAKDKKSLRSGLERLDPAKLPKGIEKVGKEAVPA